MEVLSNKSHLKIEPPLHAYFFDKQIQKNKSLLNLPFEVN